MSGTRFLADAMLGRLARWLRVVGADTIQLPLTADDHALVARAAAEDRVLLTRDRHLLRELRPVRALAVESERPLAQLAEVVRSVGMERPAELFTRCLVCNSALVTLSAKVGGALVPPGSRNLPGGVRQCPTCERAYWRGSHARRMEAAVLAALPEWGPTPFDAIRSHTEEG